MTRINSALVAFAAAAAAALPVVASTGAEAGGRGKDYYVQEYHFKRPMNGHQGFAGAYYCSYVKQPVVINGKKLWKLVQTCQ